MSSQDNFKSNPITMDSSSMNWEGSGAKTLFYQGMYSSQTQLAKYTGKTRGFIATTGEHVICANGMEAILDPHVGIEIEEVVLCNKKKWNDPFTKMQHIISRIANQYYGIKISGGELSELTVSAHSLDLKTVTVAQESDFEMHKKKYEMIANHSDIILYGVSRGAATTIQAMCLHKYNAKLVILEGCFFSVPEVFKNRYGIAATHIYSFAKWVLSKHKEDGHSPASLINEFPEQIPVAFITSKIDTSVHPESTRKLALLLASRGKNPVYLLELKKSRHPHYMFDDKDDRRNYECFLHALYREYRFPHIPELAKSGESLLQQCKL
jgi:hypothetical protein